MTKKNIYIAPETDLVTIRFDRSFMQSQFEKNENTEMFILEEDEELE